MLLQQKLSPETYTQLKFHEISFVHNIYCKCKCTINLKCWIEFGGITVGKNFKTMWHRILQQILKSMRIYRILDHQMKVKPVGVNHRGCIEYFIDNRTPVFTLPTSFQLTIHIFCCNTSDQTRQLKQKSRKHRYPYSLVVQCLLSYPVSRWSRW